MKALVYNGPFDMTIEEIERPEPKENEVQIKVRAVGLCGSDIHGFSGKTGRRYPGMVMGHEISGEIWETGSNANKFKKGQKVVVQPIISCKTCLLCREGKNSICLNKKMVGVNMDKNGGFSEFIIVPEENVFPIPEDLPFSLGALVEPFAVAASAVRHAELKKESTLLITGAGVIGISILLLSREKGLKKIFVTDRIPNKLEAVKTFGGIPLNFTEVDPIAVIKKETSDLGVDCSIEAVGLSASVQTAQLSVRPGGRIVWVGNSQKIIELDMQDIVVFAKSIQGVYCYSDEDFNTAIDFIDNNREIVSGLVEKEVTFEETTELFTKLARGEIELFRGVTVFE